MLIAVGVPIPKSLESPMSKLNIFLPLLLATSVAACAAGDDMDDFNEDKADELSETDTGEEGDEPGDDIDEVASDGYDDARNVDLAEVVLAEETLAPDEMEPKKF